MEITISGKDRKHLKLVEDLAKKLGLEISQKTDAAQKTREEQKENSEKLYQLMTEMAESGAFKAIARKQ